MKNSIIMLISGFFLLVLACSAQPVTKQPDTVLYPDSIYSGSSDSEYYNARYDEARYN